MTPYEHIDQLRAILEKDTGNDDKTITVKEHRERMQTFLNLIQSSLESAEYVFESEAIDTEIVTFESYTMTKRQLNDEVIIFQPVAVSGKDFIATADMQSIAGVIQDLVDHDLIQEKVILLAPNVNVFRAKISNAPSVDNSEAEK